ncbi:lipopolysaccharide transport periplasmic protein LptA [Photobacterium phosphoreum]|uniref:lipopolysaccharide transport periplasmic protein LptA n=1 Tax=Photobacterium phosphoreum TaxID=659 RepID=UPI0007F90AD9|nr:lipopolysaccharide transport periplasmic protein LptA [Photobacterium phosphoreum]MCD9501632.1 lipopolysaccharide transport periplasmic protein LptA [Photobacterium phosphoreum]OBU37744.1 lipopolysaccharide transport periplasmic protein LptA [Photobacterium phosphoreum]OBU47357.1 lipopolysaccharide transport periplasmic protein LptA [Photobacterium phosphoreum]PSW38636.1 lipopolysaccharide transport periplasmic protein LptA [Photobacterium phosphoreum]
MKKQLFTATLLLLLSTSVFATTAETQLPIQLSSVTQDVDVVNNTTTLIGKVDIVQGGITIKADKAVIKLNGKTKELKTIEVYGKPAYFKRVMEDGKVITGESGYGIYTPSDSMMVLKKNVKVIQNGNIIRANEISYNLKAQFMKATGTKSQQVKTKLLPETK